MRSCSRQIRSPRHRRARGPLGAEPQSSVPTLPSRRVMAHLPPIESLRDAHARTWRRLRLRPGVRSRERAGADGDRLVQRDPLSRQRRRARRQGPADRAGSAPVCFGSPVRRIDSKTFRLSRFGPAARGLRARSLGSARALPQAREWKGEHVYAVNGLSPADPNAALISVFSAGAAEIEMALRAYPDSTRLLDAPPVAAKQKAAQAHAAAEAQRRVAGRGAAQPKARHRRGAVRCGAGTFDTRRALVLGLLASVLNEPTYNQLRTIEQLGWVPFRPSLSAPSLRAPPARSTCARPCSAARMHGAAGTFIYIYICDIYVCIYIIYTYI